MVVGDIAFPIGGQTLSPIDHVPYGCGKVSIGVDHNKVTGPVAELARNMYFTRRVAEDLMHNPKLDPKVREHVHKVSDYAHDLEFFSRQLGLALKMPTGVDPPYLPLDIASLPGPAVIALLVPAAALRQRARFQMRCRTGAPGAGNFL
eukprot:TRINITY_DN86962_c0_g1_i1.p1 TRINITY_DN86962_c0_g1~~TRINITY_DN86962_c0_g1_i1.p1  ORF type:complete len:148 (-),score=20.95 TRINITY_DN86962_c0_g1_i1:52-495(-)